MYTIGSHDVTLVTLDPAPCAHVENSSLNNSTEILAIEETEKQVNSMLSDLGTMEESTTADSQQEVGDQRAEQRPRITMSPSGFELPPEASDQITTLHKEIKEMVRVGGVRVQHGCVWSYVGSVWTDTDFANTLPLSLVPCTHFNALCNNLT